MKPINFAISVAAILACAHPMMAEDFATDYAPSQGFDLSSLRVTGGISIFGYTLATDYRINENWGVRAVFGYADLKTDVVKDGTQVVSTIMGNDIFTDFPVMSTKVDTMGQAGGYGLLLDYYPDLDLFGDGFRVTGGAMATLYELNGYGVVDGIVTGPRTGQSVAIHDLEAQMNIPSISPYVGLGYNYDLDENWGISVDAGVMYNVAYDGYMKATAMNPADQQKVDVMMNKEMDMKLKELEPYPFLPFIMFGLSYRF